MSSNISSLPGSKFYEFSDFKAKFNFKNGFHTERIAKGGYGEVFNTKVGDEQFIIKSQKDFPAFVRELSILSSIVHPNIVKIEGWSSEKDKIFYIAQKRGVNINTTIEELFKNYTDKVIGDFINKTFDKILDAIRFLHKNNIVHLDIKKENIVFYGYEPCLIDFGLTTYGYRYNNGLFVKPNAAYTLDNIDPEFGYYKYNSSDSDYYALSITMIKILQEVYIKYQKCDEKEPDRFPLFISNIDFSKDKNIFKLIYKDKNIEKIYKFCSEFTKPSKDRNSEFLPKFIKEYYKDKEPDGKLITTDTKEIDFKCNTAYQLIVDYLNKMMLLTNVSARTAFLTYHNLHRCFNINIDIPNLVKLKNYGEDFSAVRDLNKFALTSLYLSEVAYSSDANKTRSKIDNLCSYEFSENEIISKSIEMIRSYGDTVVTNTLWDYANCFGSLKDYFLYTMNCNYDPKKLPVVAQCDNKDKNVSFYELAESMNGSLVTHFRQVDEKYEDNKIIDNPYSSPSLDNPYDSKLLGDDEFIEKIKINIKGYNTSKFEYAWVEMLYFIIAFYPQIMSLKDKSYKKELNGICNQIYNSTKNRETKEFITSLINKYNINLR
jgi:serine/threonine protein kinase